MRKYEKFIQVVMILFISVVFVQSLYFKFLNSPETIYIFQTKLDPWAFNLTGFHLFAQHGIFSQYVIGSAEFITSFILLVSLIPALNWIRALGGLGATCLMLGAVFFHLGTPLGISVLNADGSYDGGQLFALACVNLLLGLYLLFRNQAAFRAKVFKS